MKKKPFGKKKPFTIKQIRSIKEILTNKNKLRDLTLFSLGIDTMLRASDLLSITVDDLIDSKYNVKDEIMIIQKKTKEPHYAYIFEDTRTHIKNLIIKNNLIETDYLFCSKKNKCRPITVRQLRNLVKEWANFLGLDKNIYGTHSMRRTRASYIYKKTNNIEAVRILLGQKSVTSTSSYLDIEKEDAFRINKNFSMQYLLDIN